ncbi:MULTISPECIES: aspartate/glutamate racemase family protein [unclassified Halanaerobium]|uniref:aspartate/glutamate racemase family protein n=1 Tax=unclassified Halanaerobium TaxID=2641197 RepID=UPI000DF32571|nr:MULTISPECIES: aspartate/glutamate racemase family protein [unclassified Halanaerobium]RCW40119.1 aspartate racemase [Halanaerobium sp. MA284_MarDTE_T2]RCW80751.1 aspartate racemase [Halanaerobium sp. DL-01]
MKRIGLIGGMSWESSLEYYRIINEEVKKKLGSSHSADLVMYSFDFAEVEKLQHENKWDELTEIMIDKAKLLKNAGAEVIAICTNTMHKMAGEIEENTELPLIHIADSAAAEMEKKDIKKAALLGTKFTMEEDFYRDRISKYGIEIIIPDKKQREVIHNTIYSELISGVIKDSSRKKFVEIIESLQKKGAEGVVLGCTEIPLLIKNNDSPIEVFDTTYLHAKNIVNFSLDISNKIK